MSLQIDGYTIQKKLGTGGMSTVYLAIQESLGRPCALKVMSPALTQSESFTHRFKLEGKTIAKLQHSNIVNIYDIATNDDLCYIAMEYLPGGSLHDRLHDDMSLQEVLAIVKQVARALGFAHDHSIIHRDIKPANIMFRRDGTAVLTDYGIAKNLTEETAALTGTGSLIGTPAYMSPEQIQVGTLTGRSDLYSLGVVFYETLIGVQPYVASNPIAVAFMHVNKAIPTLPDSVRFLQSLLNKFLAKDPTRRFQTAQELISAIEKIEREHDTSRIMLLHSSKGHTANGAAEPGSLLSQFPDTRLITVLDSADQAAQQHSLSGFRTKKPWMWLTLAAVAGLLLWGGLSYRAYHAEQQQLHYKNLLAVADRQIEQNRIITPANDNLYSSLLALQELSADDPRAAAATTAFVDHILIEARREQAHGTFDSSLALIDKGLQFMPDDAGLRNLRKQVEAQERQRQKELLQQQQEQAIERLLALAQAQIEAGKLTAPDGDNAVNSLSQVLALAPEQKQALAGLDSIAEHFAQRARQALNEDNETLAREIIDKSLSISASNATLLQQKSTLLARIAQRERTEQIRQAREQQAAELLAKAATQLQQGRLVGPGEANAAASYQQLLQLDKNNDQALAGLRQVASKLAARAESNLQQGEFAASQTDIKAALTILPNDKELLQLQQSITAKQQQLVRAERTRKDNIQRLLQLARQQTRERKLNNPANDNALHSLQQILALEPDNQQAREGLRKIADAYEGLAREQLAQGNDERSKSYSVAGLNVIPEHNGLLAVQRELLERQREQQLRETMEREARAEQVTRLLASAEQQFDAHQFTTPDNRNAYATWRAVLTLEPNNKAAQQAIDKLPEHILQQASADLNAGNLPQSEQVLQQGLQVWPDDSGLLDLQKSLQRDKHRQERAAEISALLRTAERQRKSGKLFSPTDDNAVASLQQVLALDSNNSKAKAALAGIIDDRLKDTRHAIQQKQFDHAEALLEEADNAQLNNSKLKNLAGELAVQRRISTLLNHAEELAAQYQFTQPEQHNAYSRYREVLRINPIQAEANVALMQMPQRIVDRAEDAIEARNWQLAASLITQGLQLVPADKRLLALNTRMLNEQTQVVQQRKQREQKQRIKRLLTVAGNQMGRQQLTSPAGDNAAATLEQILVLDPKNAAALQLMADISDRYAALATQALRTGEENRARVLVERGLRLSPENPRLKARKAELQQLEEQREVEKLAKAQQEKAHQQAAEQRAAEKAERVAAQQRATEQAERVAVEQQQRQEKAASEPRAGQKKEPVEQQGQQRTVSAEQQSQASETEQQPEDEPVATLIRQAELQRRRDQLLAPSGDNALESYRQALQLDPLSDAAQAGIEAIKDYFRTQVQAWREARDIPMAAAWLEAVRAEFPTDAGLQPLQQSLMQRSFQDKLRDSTAGPALVYIPAGSFTMGDSSGSGFANELPAHKENISRGFMLGREEVTFEQFDRYVRATDAASPTDQGWGRGKLPVINVDWPAAKQYLAWLSRQSGHDYRLPSEMEWEYAARAGAATDYWWGAQVGSNNANCKGCGSANGGRRSMEVGSFAANPFGLFDTAGNVHEWVTSPYAGHYPPDGSSIKGHGTNAIARGGSWYDEAKFSRASMRVILKPDFKNFFVGFRVLRSLPTPVPFAKQ